MFGDIISIVYAFNDFVELLRFILWLNSFLIKDVLCTFYRLLIFNIFIIFIFLIKILIEQQFHLFIVPLIIVQKKIFFFVNTISCTIIRPPSYGGSYKVTIVCVAFPQFRIFLRNELLVFSDFLHDGK